MLKKGLLLINSNKVSFDIYLQREKLTHIQVLILLDCNLGCKHTNSKESFPKSEIRLKLSNSDTRKSTDIFDSRFRFRVLVPSLTLNQKTFSIWQMTIGL